jgi:hypothetical protein
MKRVYRTCAAAAIAVSATVGLGVPGAGAASTPGWRFAEVYPQSQGLDSVSASSASNAWAVGAIGPADPSCIDCLFTSHWNGKSWQTIPQPNGLEGPDIYVGGAFVAATSRASAWVFADRESDDSGASRVAAVEWTGRSWSTVHYFAGPAYVFSAIASGPDDVWGFGGTGKNYQTPWVVHYNGKTWSRVSMPVIPAATSGSAAAGDWGIADVVPQPKTGPAAELLHWSKGAWKRVLLPKITVPKGLRLLPYEVVAVTPADVYASVTVGPLAGPGPATSILLHWNGKRWSKVPQPSGAGTSGLASDGHGGLWGSRGTFDKAGNLTGTVMYHYSAGRWTHVRAPSEPGLVTRLVGSLELIPGTESILGAAYLTGPDSQEGAILEYGP